MKHNIDFDNEIKRKIIHLSSVWMPIFIWYFNNDLVTLVFFSLFIIVLTSELLRFNSEVYRTLYYKFFYKMMRFHEIKDQRTAFTGSFYVILGVLIAVVVFSKIIAITAISVMVVSDAFAALIGRKYGRIIILDKTLEGFLAFIFFGILTIGVIYLLILETQINYNFIISGSIAVIVAGVIELMSKHLRIDDNLSVIISVGIVMTLLSKI